MAGPADPAELARVLNLLLQAFLCLLCIVIPDGLPEPVPVLLLEFLFFRVFLVIAGPAFLIPVKDLREFPFLEA